MSAGSRRRCSFANSAAATRGCGGVSAVDGGRLPPVCLELRCILTDYDAGMRERSPRVRRSLLQSPRLRTQVCSHDAS